ncbi:MAG: metallophosphoesterase [Caldilineales bacterium]|nr:metallophosphoesterase [Caldilineales bacterium]
MSHPPAAPLFPAARSLAIFSDVHGNIRALEAVLADIAAQDVDAVVCNGDLVTSSAHSPAVVQRLRQLGIPSTRGNHERYLHEMADPADAKWRQANWAPTRHDYSALSADDRAWLTSLPDMLWLVEGPAPLFMAHAAPGCDTARVTAQTDAAAWDAHFAGLPPNATLIGSHLHWFWQRRWRGRQFVRTPAAGLPLDGDSRAGYVILRRQGASWQAEPRRLTYDWTGELAALRSSEYYRAGGVLAHLFWEELRTARWWIVPFFAHARRISAQMATAPSEADFDADTLLAAWHSFDRGAAPEYAPDAPHGHT